MRWYQNRHQKNLVQKSSRTGTRKFGTKKVPEPEEFGTEKCTGIGTRELLGIFHFLGCLIIINHMTDPITDQNCDVRAALHYCNVSSIASWMLQSKKQQQQEMPPFYISKSTEGIQRFAYTLADYLLYRLDQRSLTPHSVLLFCTM